MTTPIDAYHIFNGPYVVDVGDEPTVRLRLDRPDHPEAMVARVALAMRLLGMAPTDVYAAAVYPHTSGWTVDLRAKDGHEFVWLAPEVE